MSAIYIKEKRFIEYITKDEIEIRVGQIKDELLTRFQDQKPVFIVVLRGAFIFASDLLKLYNAPCEIEFVKLSSYAGMQSTGKINLDLPLNEEKIRNRDIIILEDIVDSGLTMLHFKEYLSGLQPKSITLVSFLVKPESIEKEVKVDIVGFSIPSHFVIGYGLDYDGEGRNLNAVYQLEEVN